MQHKGSQTEYNPLQKVVLGRFDDTNHFPKNDLSMLAMIAADQKLYTPEGRLDLVAAKEQVPDVTSEIQEKTESELAVLESFFLERNISVVRPDKVNFDQEVVTPHYRTTQFPVYCPRDIIFNFRDLIIISPNLYRSRVHEASYYHSILNEEKELGRIVILTPRPRLHEDDLDLTAGSQSILNTKDAVFEAANTLIDGEHNAIYYQVSHSGNIQGYHWLKEVIGKFYPDVTVYPLYIYDGIHFDTTIAILNYDTVALNPERVTDINSLPEPLKQRKHIYPDLLSIRNENALSSMWIGMNSLSVSPTELIVDADQVRYIEQLTHAGFTVFPHKLTYCDVLEGGHHCTSSDLRRLENY